MKKFVKFLATTLFVAMFSTTVFADTTYEVYATENRESATNYTVSIETKGNAADGITVIAYDATKMNCEESDIVMSENVDMYSVNVENGTVKVSYLAEKPIAAGSIFTVSFEVKEEYADEEMSVTVSSVAHNEDGEALETGSEEDDTENQGSVTPNNPTGNHTSSNSTQTSTDTTDTTVTGATNTGDTPVITIGVLVLCAGLIVVAFVAAKKKKAQ
ncbi:hypothetical protein [Sharpea azabuensis]